MSNVIVHFYDKYDKSFIQFESNSGFQANSISNDMRLRKLEYT
jgi:hypothetical protein